jgi:hypothetical protein
MLFSGVLQHSTKQHQQDINQPEQHARHMPALPNESNLTTSTRETTDTQ